VIKQLLSIGLIVLAPTPASRYVPPTDFRPAAFEEQAPTSNVEDRFFTIQVAHDLVGVSFARLEAGELGLACAASSSGGRNVEIVDVSDPAGEFAEPLLWLDRLGFKATLWLGKVCATGGGSLDEELDFPLYASVSAWGAPGVRERVRSALTKANVSWRGLLKVGVIRSSGRIDEGQTTRLFQSGRGSIEERKMKPTPTSGALGKKQYRSKSCRSEAIFSWTPSALRVDFRKNSITTRTLFVSADPSADLVESFDQAQKQLCSELKNKFRVNGVN
jgi:hypothetical protein